MTLFGIPVLILLFKVGGLYDREQVRVLRSTLDEAPVLLQLAGLYALAVAILRPLVVEGHLGSAQIAALWLSSVLAIVGGRMCARWLAGRASAIERCLVIGDPERAMRIRDKLRAAARAPSSRRRCRWRPTRSTGSTVPRASGGWSTSCSVDRIIIAPGSERADVTELIRLAKSAGVQVSLLPRMLEVVGSTVEFEDIDGMTMLGVRPFGLTRSSRLLKRVFDLVATTVGLVVVGPVIAAIAVAIRLDSKGPVFFRQVRVGRDGQHVQDLQVPLDGRRRRGAEGASPGTQRGRRRDVQDQPRSACDAGREHPAHARRSTSSRSCST